MRKLGLGFEKEGLKLEDKKSLNGSSSEVWATRLSHKQSHRSSDNSLIAANYNGVSNCYVFKSRLQEYAQKAGLPTPAYDTIKEGPSHEPSFRSTVIVNDVRFDSLPGFFNRKAAEQSAAEVALTELTKSSDIKECISPPVHETGLCKNLLQEYAQKMNYAIPSYICRRDETSVRVPLFSCSVEIGGILYIGAAAKTKKEAEIKAARTALLAIQSSASEASGRQLSNSQLTVIPSKKREPVSNNTSTETADALKPTKARFKKKPRRRRTRDKPVKSQIGNTGGLEINMNASIGLEAAKNYLIERVNFNSCEREISAVQGVLASEYNGIVQNEQSIAANDDQTKYRTSATGLSSVPYGGLTSNQIAASCVLAGCNQSEEKIESELSSVSNGEVTALVKEASKVSGAVEVVAATISTVGQTEASFVMDGFNQMGEKIESGVSSVSNGELAAMVKEVSNVSGDGDGVVTAISSVMGQIEDSGMIASFNQSEEKIESGAD